MRSLKHYSRALLYFLFISFSLYGGLISISTGAGELSEMTDNESFPEGALARMNELHQNQKRSGTCDFDLNTPTPGWGQEKSAVSGASGPSGRSPYLYLFDNNKYIFHSDFLAGATSKQKEATSIIDITPSSHAERHLKLKISEELDETTYLDRIYLQVTLKQAFLEKVVLIFTQKEFQLLLFLVGTLLVFGLYFVKLMRNKSQIEFQNQVVHFVIFFSGIAALIYELLWVRMLHLLFGVSSFAVATVVAVFMFGLGLGSIIFGKVAEKSKNVLITYAYLELGIAILSTVSYILLNTHQIDKIYHLIYNYSNFYTISLVRLLISSLILLPPTLAIGGTIPLITKYLTVSNQTLGSKFSIIYYVNTFGAFFGVILTGFILVQFFGIRTSFLIAVFINVVIFLTVLLISRGKTLLGAAKIDEGESLIKVREMLPLLFLTGFISLGYEVSWTRGLTNLGLTTTYSFSMILGGFLLGIMFGSYLISKFIDKLKDPIIHFSIYSMIVGFLGATVLLLFNKFKILSAEVFTLFGFYGRLPFYAEPLLGTIISFVPAVFMGMMFPLGVRLYAGNTKGIGEKVGRAYLANTFGALLGSLSAGFVFIPFIGIKYANSILISLSFIISGYMLHLAIRYNNKRQKTIIVSLFLLILMIASSALFSFSSNLQTFGRDKLIYYSEGLSAVVTVEETIMPDGQAYKKLKIDSQGVAGTDPVMTIDSKMLAHIPLLLVKDPKTAVTVGFGSGGTSYSMLLHEVDVYAVEIEKKVIEASHEFAELNFNSQNNPALHLVIDDARNYLDAVNKTFDVIVTDVTNLKYKSNPSLYSKDYFEIMRNALSDKGVAAAWIPMGGLSFSDLQILTASFEDVFPHTTIWYFSPKLTHFLVLIGTKETLSVNLNLLKERLPVVKSDFQNSGVNNEYDLGANLFMGEKDVDQLVKGAMIHTDNDPVLEFSDIDAYFTADAFDNFERLLSFKKENLIHYFDVTDMQKVLLMEMFHLVKMKYKVAATHRIKKPALTPRIFLDPISISDADRALISDYDNEYFVMKRGAEHVLEFKLPENYEKIEFVAQGYYRVHEKNKNESQVKTKEKIE
ncbi:fused MFS/spermidine synthase [candidate division CSSED10-310 bacterium]|uniref:Fused MFS/spermidine synthase n=1 Tax=candidate division CSSED10-310 bacterium TaxID=2855610 RepID=A0ABV6YYD6_UNCC1